MVVTETLIQNQKREANQIDAKYTVTLSGGGATNEEKPVLEALLPGVRLRFLRYGMFLKHGENKANALRIKDHTDEEFTLSDADVSNGDLNTTDHFMVGATRMREGYVYLINPDDDTDCHELQIDPFGKMSHIIWDSKNFYPDNKKPKDKRTSEGDSIDYKRIINKNQNPRTFWIGYSPVQWSHLHFEKVLNMSDDERKALHMVLVSTGGIKKGEETAQEHVLPYNKIEFVYHKDDPMHHHLKAQLKQIAATEHRESQKGTNDVLEDMFITLHDPIGAVEDIAFELEELFGKQETIVEAIQNGEDYDVVAKRRKNGQTKDNFSKEQQQLQALFQTALTTYHLVYGDSRMEDDYDGGTDGYWKDYFKGSGVDKIKVEHVLGTEYRKECRKEIRAIRDELGQLMHTDYYKDAWNHYATSVDDYILDGKFKVSSHIALLNRKPHSVDRHLDLKKNYEDTDDRWEDFFTEVLDFDDSKPINRLLDQPVEVFFLTGPILDLENKLGGVVRNLVSSYADKTTKTEMVTYSKVEEVTKQRTVTKTVKVPDYQEVVFKRLQTLELGGNPFMEVHTKEIEAAFKGSTLELDRSRVKIEDKYQYNPQDRTKKKEPSKRSRRTQFRLDDQNRILVTRVQLTDEVVLKKELRKRGKNPVVMPVLRTETQTTVEDYIEQVRKDYMKRVDSEIYKRPYGELAEKLFNGKIFTGSLALLQVFNVANAATTFGQDPNFKNFVNASGITAELLEANYYYKRAVAISKNLSDNTIKTLYKKSQFYGNIGAGVTVFMCAWEAFDSQNARDYDAMWAWAGAGAAWGAFGFAGSTVSWSALGGLSIELAGLGFTPWGLAIGAAALGLTALAYYLKDTPLEAFFKNNILSDALASPDGSIGEKPWVYAKKLYADRDHQTPEPSSWNIFGKDEFKKWEDMQVMYQDLMDILVCADIIFEPTALVHKKSIRANGGTITAEIDISDIISYKAEISFRQFLTTEEQLVFEVYYFQNKTDQNGKLLDLKESNICIEKQEGVIPKAIIDFTLYKNDLKKNNPEAHIVFVCKLALEKDSYYPMGITGEDRYIGAKFNTEEKVMVHHKGLFNKKEYKNSNYQAAVAIDTLPRLLSKEAWKDKPFNRKVHGQN